MRQSISKFKSAIGYTNGQTTLTVTAGAYSAGDVVGGVVKFDIPSAAGGCLLNQIAIFDDDNQGAAMDVYLMSAEPTAIADNAAFASAFDFDSMQNMIVGVQEISTYTTVNSNQYAFQALDKAFVSGVNGIDTIWAFFVTNGSTPTYTATTGKLIFRLDYLTQG